MSRGFDLLMLRQTHVSSCGLFFTHRQFLWIAPRTVLWTIVGVFGHASYPPITIFLDSKDARLIAREALTTPSSPVLWIAPRTVRWFAPRITISSRRRPGLTNSTPVSPHCYPHPIDDDNVINSLPRTSAKYIHLGSHFFHEFTYFPTPPWLS